MTPTLQEGVLQPDAIAAAPAAQGAYRLWAGSRLLHIGHTSALQTLRGELRRHWRGDYGPRTQAASHFDYLVAADAAHAHELYLSLYISSGLRDHVPRVRA